MPVDAIGIIADPAASVPRNAGISQEDFLRILLSQLRFQDPLKPVDNEQFVAQLAQFSALEINREQSEKIDSLLNIQATNQAIALVGKNVQLRGAQTGSIGTVTAIEFPGGEARLTLRQGAATDPNAVFVRDVRLSDIALVY